jgi:hypothetical protein
VQPSVSLQHSLKRSNYLQHIALTSTETFQPNSVPPACCSFLRNSSLSTTLPCPTQIHWQPLNSESACGFAPALVSNSENLSSHVISCRISIYRSGFTTIFSSIATVPFHIAVDSGYSRPLSFCCNTTASQQLASTATFHIASSYTIASTSTLASTTAFH